MSAKPAYRLTLELPGVPPTLNEALRMHFAQRRKINQAWYEAVWAVTRGKLPASPLERARLRIERHAPRTLDFDGCVGSFKPVIDGLIHAGVLSGDSWRVTGPWQVDQGIVDERDAHVFVVVEG